MSVQTQTKAPAHDVLATGHLYADLKGRSVRGSFWTITSQGATFALQTIYTVVLARLLTPTDFGLVAMVFAIAGLGMAFADLGLSEATIQRQDINTHQVSVLFWVNVAIGLVLTLVMVALAPVLVWFYREPRLKNLTFVMAAIFLIGGFRVQHNAILQRQMRFASMAMRDVVSSALAVIVAITMAWRGAGYWAIVAFPLTSYGVGLVLSWVMVRWIPGLPRRDERVGSMISFGGKVAASYLINYLNYNTDNILVGWYWGAGPLGLYSRAYNLLMLPVRQLNAPIGRVAVPAFSRLQNDPERFARYYLRAANLVIWVAMPIFGFLFVAAHPVILLVLGHKWVEAGAVFQILSIAALAQLLLGPATWLLVSKGQSGRLLNIMLIIFPILVFGYAVGLPFGINGVALTGSLVLVAILPWVLKYTFRGTLLTLRRLGRAILCPVSLSLTGVVLAEFSLRAIAPQNVFLQLLVVALGFAVAYSASMLLRPVREEAMSLRRLLSELRSPSPAVQSQIQPSPVA
ncbi:MAG: lipopolysaccharide biosynthesis protein [Terriglobia bacterium]